MQRWQRFFKTHHFSHKKCSCPVASHPKRHFFRPFLVKTKFFAVICVLLPITTILSFLLHHEKIHLCLGQTYRLHHFHTHPHLSVSHFRGIQHVCSPQRPVGHLRDMPGRAAIAVPHLPLSTLCHKARTDHHHPLSAAQEKAQSESIRGRATDRLQFERMVPTRRFRRIFWLLGGLSLKRI